MKNWKNQEGFHMNKAIMLIALSFAAIASVVYLVVNLAVQRTVSWALYPIGSMAWVIAVMCPVLFCKKGKLESAAVVGFGATLGLLYIVQFLTKTSGWVWACRLLQSPVFCYTLQ